MIGELDKLQEAVANQMRRMSDFNIADIIVESAKILEKNLGGKAGGIKIIIAQPMPVEASKYSVGPAFSKVSLQIKVERDNTIAVHSPTILYICESISKALHNWRSPVSCGYNKITLDELKPWEKLESENNKSAMMINFTAQSVLE